VLLVKVTDADLLRYLISFDGFALAFEWSQVVKNHITTCVKIPEGKDRKNRVTHPTPLNSINP
jgi:hypothetical protein